MITGTRLEELIEPLFEINRGRAGHVIKVVTLSIPGQRWAHRGAVTRVKKIIRAGKILLLSKCCRGVAEIRCMVIKKLTAVLPRRAACERNAHREHRLHGRGFYAEEFHSPFAERVCKRSARS